MERSRRRRPSPALVIACLALFVALGGTVLAATKIDGQTIRVKSLPGNRLEIGSLPGNRLKKGTIPGTRLAPRSVKGGQIDVETLGQVPSATHADSADTARHAQTATAADHAADATTVNGHAVGCEQGRREFAGACWDMGPGADAVTAIEAVAACGAEGGELPELLPLFAFTQLPGVPPVVEGEWTGTIHFVSANSYGPAVAEGGNHFGVGDEHSRYRYRCVTPLLN